MLIAQPRQPWFSENFRCTSFIVLFYALLAAAILAPIGSISGISDNGTYIADLAAVIQAKLALSAGQFPLRTLPLAQGGWLYPFYQFYAPTTFTFTGMIYKWLSPANPLIAMKFTFWLSLTLGAAYMYRLALWLIKSMPAAVLAGVIYSVAPYQIITVDRLGNLCECLALGLIPVVLFYTLRRYYFPQKNSHLLKAGLSWYLLITTHIITFVYTSLFTGLLLLLVTLKNPRHTRHLIAVASAWLLGCLLAMWYLAPVAMLGNYFEISASFNNPALIAVSHPLFSNLILSAFSYTMNTKSMLEDLYPAIGSIEVLAAVLCLYAATQRRMTGLRRADYWMPYLLTLFLFAFLLTWSPINIWRWLPSTLCIGQYTWRLLAQINWLCALLAAWAICWLANNKLDVRHITVGTVLVIISSQTWYPLSNTAPVSLQNFIKNPALTYQPDAFKIDFLKYTSFVDTIVSSRLAHDTLKVDSNYSVTKPLLQFAENPVLEIHSQIPDSLARRHLHISVYADDNEIGRQTLSAGNFNWNIDLQTVKKWQTGLEPLHVKFLLRDENDKMIHEDLPHTDALLSGFIPPQTIMPAAAVQPNCQMNGIIQTCDVNVPAGVKLLILPALYYPHMLKVSVADKPVAYKSVMSAGNLMTGIVPTAGRNKIEIEFTGIPWANWASWAAWSMMGVLSLQSLLWYWLGARRARRLHLQADLT